MGSSAYDEEAYIQLSGLQHAAFCLRQFALIHLEGIWRENALTAQGRAIHDNAHDPFFTEKRGDLITSRSVPVVSRALGISGEADVVEWRKNESGARLKGRDGFWRPAPVEYKRGKPKKGAEDEVQLCAQAICLEEMMRLDVPKGYLYYWEIRSRIEVAFSEELRQKVKDAANAAREIMETGELPPPDRPETRCKQCSMVNDCMPAVKGGKSASAFLLSKLKEAGI